MAMELPAHPGRLIQAACVGPLGLSVSDADRVIMRNLLVSRWDAPA